jgi:hypothetical protein
MPLDKKVFLFIDGHNCQKAQSGPQFMMVADCDGDADTRPGAPGDFFTLPGEEDSK